MENLGSLNAEQVTKTVAEGLVISEAEQTYLHQQNDPNLYRFLDGIEVRKLTHEYKEGVTDLLAYMWPSHNMLTMAIGVTRDEYYPLAAKRVKKAIKQENSYVCLDTESDGKVIAFLICIDYVDKDEDKWLDSERTKRTISPKFFPHFEFSKTVYSPYANFHKETFGHYPRRGDTIILDLGGVHPSYMGTGISYCVLFESMRWALLSNYETCLCNCTTFPSQVLMKKYGFLCVHEEVFADFMFQGAKPFKKIKRPPTAQLYQYNLVPLRETVRREPRSKM